MKKSSKKKIFKESRTLGTVALIAFGFATILMVCGFSKTLVEVKEDAISRTPDAILASAGLTEGKTVSLPVTYFDQEADECVDIYDLDSNNALKARQFEWSKCGYYNKSVEKGLVDYYLDEHFLPVALGGKLMPNRGVVGKSSENSNFQKWFTAVEGKSSSYAGVLKMDYREMGAEFSFYKAEFYPLDDVKNDTMSSADPHNHLFTMDFAVPFRVLFSGNENFEITADDDTFVFVGDKLAVDMGGIHDAVTGQMQINTDGEVYAKVGDEDFAFTGIDLRDSESSMIRIFHADRDSDASTFNIKFTGMDLSIMDSKLAEKDDGVQIAYDPTDPTFVAPLGESMVVKPSAVKGHIILATIEGFFIVVFAVLLMISIRFMVKSHQARKQQ